MTDTPSIQTVITRMQAIDAQLPRKDGVAIFNRLYLEVTKAVLAALRAQRPAVEAGDALGIRYLRARSWRPRTWR